MDLGMEKGEVLGVDVKELVGLNLIISMYEDVPHADNLLPGRVGMCFDEIVRKLIGGLSNDFYIFHHGIKQHGVVCEVCFGASVHE